MRRHSSRAFLALSILLVVANIFLHATDRKPFIILFVIPGENQWWGNDETGKDDSMLNTLAETSWNNLFGVKIQNVTDEQLARAHQKANTQSVNETRDKAYHHIPHQFIFTSKYPSLDAIPSHLHDNVMNTVQVYRTAWNEPEAPIWYLNNTECMRALLSTEHRLVSHFMKERRGDYKGDMCRLAALYRTGGYYFDIDMRILKAVPLKPNVTFASPHESGYKGFFNSFVAVSPKHPIIKKNLDIIMDYYSNKTRGSGVRGTHLGTGSLKAAYDEIPERERGKTHMTLEEINLKPGLYPHLPRQEGQGLCNYIVRDTSDNEVYFFSRIVGAGPNCQPKRPAPLPEIVKRNNNKYYLSVKDKTKASNLLKATLQNKQSCQINGLRVNNKIGCSISGNRRT